MADGKGERRSSPRYSIDFMLEVAVQDKEGRQHVEKSELVDLSSGGAKFVTHHPDWYSVHRKVHITTFLPGAEHLQACMKGTATVQWIATSKAEGGQSLWEVGISIDQPWDFKRDLTNTSGAED